MIDVSMDDLKNVLRDFYNVTKFLVVLYDSDRNIIYAYPEHMCKFCEAVRTNNTLAEKCFACDNIGFDICDKTRKPYIYKCHMSVIEAIAPIYANEVNMGYLMFGQILENDYKEVYEKAKAVSQAYNVELTDDIISEMTVADMLYINSAVNMMTMCASYLYTNEIIRNNPDIFVYQLKNYIRAHLHTDISIKTICKNFYISQTKLYKISRDNFNMGISDYIRLERIKKAKKLIVNTNDSISQIASAVGIKDTNYFIRIFKQAEGVTPLQYRKSM